MCSRSARWWYGKKSTIPYAGLTFAAVPGEPLKRPFQVAMRMWAKGFYVRYGGDAIQLAPPFISTEAEIDRLVNSLGEAICDLD